MTNVETPIKATTTTTTKATKAQKAAGRKAIKSLAASLAKLDKTTKATKGKGAKATKQRDGKGKGESLVDQLIALLKSAKGATNEEAAEKLGFKTAQSVRGTINGPVRKRHTVKATKDDKRGTVYRITK